MVQEESRSFPEGATFANQPSGANTQAGAFGRNPAILRSCTPFATARFGLAQRTVPASLQVGNGATGGKEPLSPRRSPLPTD
ncbi:hypothetical protein LOK74_13870 [Brevibacillus humidisoli]|uniref:hypothetical protein n=1 Tax=Brevibacillus humidisoli TaxID=2895522 RepID=UPI001E31CC2B|nr:hypothetical protein [Brevibacillus humidisoli]UFJ39157.1 hypothetical protein LOK74_13870 [Brevibacillus humidisoli]